MFASLEIKITTKPVIPYDNCTLTRNVLAMVKIIAGIMLTHGYEVTALNMNTF